MIEHQKHVTSMNTCPTSEEWNLRAEWCESQISNRSADASYLVSEQACALLFEAQTCYCAGAWIAVIILCYTALDAHLREVETGDYQSNGQDLLDSVGLDHRYQQLRKRRNRLVHIEENKPSVTIDALFDDQSSLQSSAQDAIQLTADVFFMSPGT